MIGLTPPAALAREELRFVDATPDEGYVGRILRAHLAAAEAGEWVGGEGTGAIAEVLNQANRARARLLRAALEKLGEPTFDPSGNFNPDDGGAWPVDEVPPTITEAYSVRS